ncbi:MAG: hypothetical protein HC845_09110 [Akkermansiaceae bacterium]|nr:hypothetical protein [Akkermansiaceae bacterium]
MSNAPGGDTIVKHRDGIRRPADDGDPFNDPKKRPVILNRPFQSVADMGYAFRDEPWTSLNLYGDPNDSNNPGDGALLDLFGMTEAPARAGVVNLNTAPVPVLKSLLSQTAIRTETTLTDSNADSYAKRIREILDVQPLMNNAEIAPLANKIADKNRSLVSKTTPTCTSFPVH